MELKYDKYIEEFNAVIDNRNNNIKIINNSEIFTQEEKDRKNFIIENRINKVVLDRQPYLDLQKPVHTTLVI